MKKYEKPLAHALNDFSVAMGHLCLSGKLPTQDCNAGGTNVGPCDTYGVSAGRACNPTGGSPFNPSAPCNNGNIATTCSATGSFASLNAIPQ